MTYKINKPVPVTPPPTMISIEMTEREATLLKAFLGSFNYNDFQSRTNDALITYYSGTDLVHDYTEDAAALAFDALRDALKEIKD